MPSVSGQNTKNSTILPNGLRQTAGIDPKSGRIWFGDSAIEIVERRRAEGLTSPLFFERVGYAAYFRKGRRSDSRNYEMTSGTRL